MKIRFEPRKKRRGAILLEAAIGLMLIAVVLLGIMAAFSMTLTSVVEMHDAESARMIAVGLLNELEGVDFSHLKGYARNLLERSRDHYPGFTIAANSENDIVKMYPAINPVSAEITIALRRNGRGNDVVMTREVSKYDLRSASGSN